MPQNRRTWINHAIAGGWATNRGSYVVVPAEAESPIPFLANAENIVYELDGGFQKSPGSTKINASALESGATITGLYDFWTSTGVQKRLIHIGTKIKKDDADGTFTDIFTGLTAGAIPCYAQLDDLVVIASSAAGDVPRSYDGTTAQNLAGSPPNFSICVIHKGRVFVAGVPGNLSRVYWCTYTNPEGWSGIGSGFVDVDPDDGDQVTGLTSHNDDLFIFKGPYKGSIHRLTGSAPTGQDAFALKPLVRGVGSVNQNGIFHYANDVGFMWSDGSIRTLSSVDNYGDFQTTALTYPIQNWIRENINFDSLNKIQAAVTHNEGYALIAVPIFSSTDNNRILYFDFKFNPPRWGLWTDVYNAVSLAPMIDPDDDNNRIIMAGGDDGFVRKMLQLTRIVDSSTGIPTVVTTPFLDYGGTPQTKKSLTAACLTLVPKSANDVDFRISRDEEAQQTFTIAQGGSAFLAPTSGTAFTLGTHTLGSGKSVRRFADVIEGGEFRDIEYEFRNNESEGDFRLQTLSVQIEPHGMSTENPS